MTETLFGVLLSISNELVKKGVNSIWPKTKKKDVLRSYTLSTVVLLVS